MRAPPWIAIYLNQPLTEKPSCEAEHMAAPTNAANVKKALANATRELASGCVHDHGGCGVDIGRVEAET
jgi:hypothetical protein